jgi:putative ABC transport system permease protein
MAKPHVRKVVGASVAGNWLQGFAYRVNSGANVFFVAGISIILMTVFTISCQSIKAALANPVKSLRTE